jgi:putative ABC transport system ATP-binding protein
MLMDPTISARSLHKHYPMGETGVDALRGIDLAVAHGEFVAIMGPSGSGKSTLLHLLGGLETVSSGEVRLGERSLASLTERQITVLRRRRIGVVFQFFNLLPTMTARENVALPLLLDGIPSREIEARVDEALGWVGLQDRASHTPDRLSGGEQQRVALARALISGPDLVLADEPTGNLDSASGDQVLDLLQRACRERGQTVVMVTHDPAAAARAGRVIFLRDGRIRDEIRGPGLTAEAIARSREGA